MGNGASRSSAQEPAGDQSHSHAFSNVASKVVLLVFAATLVTATLVSWVSIQSSGASLRGMIDRLYPRSLDHAAQRLEPWVESQRLALAHLAHRDLGEEEEPAPSTLARFDGLLVLDGQGGIARSWGIVPSDARSALDAPDGLAGVALPTGGAALAMAVVRETPERAVVGVVSLARAVALLESELPSDEALLVLVDGEDRVLLRAGRAPAGLDLATLDLRRLEANGSLRETEIGGIHMIATMRELALLDWRLAIVTPFDAAYAAVLTAMARILLIDLAIILFFSFVAYLVAGRVMRPIERLAESARRIAQGARDLQPLDASARDELGEIGRAFNEIIRVQKRQRDAMEETNRTLKDRNFRLQQANETLSQLSITDGLTKLHNHRFFQDYLTREIRRIERTREPLAMLLLDIDDFKKLNDTYGHTAGDEILERIAQLLESCTRGGSDLCARYGGEEFVVLTPGNDVQGACQLAEKIRREIGESSFIVADSLRPLRATVSVGVAVFRGDRKHFFRKADQALYQAKADGKDCVVVHEEDLEPHGAK